MTLFTGTLDDNAQRARLFLESSRKLAPDLPWHEHTDTRLGRLALTLDAPQAPYSTFEAPSGQSVFVLGDVLHTTQLDNATWLHSQCQENGPAMLARQNGHHLTGMLDEHEAIYLAADQLGLMPVYYWGGADHFSFSTSPNAFLPHPGFTAKPDLMGIAGILLTMHATGNRTTWQDVKRLPPGHLLRWRKGEGITLSDVNTLKAHDSYFGWPQSRCQSLIQNSFNEAVQRLDKLGETSVMLSGGLDSRLVAGCLRWHARYKVPAITLGASSDYEMQCARGVAKSLGWPMHPVAVNLDAYPSWAPIQARLEGMQSSFVEFMWWQAASTANKLKPRIMTGLLGDSVMGGSHLAEGFNKDSCEYNFRAQFESMNRYGFKAEVISKLIGQPGLAETVVEELHKTWSGYDGMSFQKCWLFDLHHRQRLHVGAIAWRFSYGAWPTLPYVDQDLLNVMAGMAAPAFSERQAQNNMLCNKFPKLAALPLDRGGPDIHPLAPHPMWRLKHYLSSRFSMFRPGAGQVEKRQYVRHFDINSRGWVAVRRLAEQHRPHTRSLFNPVVLEEMLPSSDNPLLTPDAVVDSARYKTLLGLFLQLGTSAGSPYIDEIATGTSVQPVDWRKRVMEGLFIGAPDITQEGEYTVLAAPVRAGKAEMRLWLRVPASVNPALSSDPFFPACLIPAMALGQPFEIETPISEGLPGTADAVQNIFHNWFPDLARIPVLAETASKPRGRPGGVGCFFSGGVDSLHTFLKHEQEITTLIYVHGFDVDFNDDALRKKVSDALRAFAAKTGKSLIEVETNLRDFTNQYGDWGEKIHGSALASVALLLDSLLERVYIPSSYAYSELFPWASHPLVDPLWSTEAIQIIHDGCEATRFEKVTTIAGDARALSTLRVCWENRNGAYNCGACEKCLRTMTALEVLGSLDKCPTFQTSFDLESVRRFELKSHGASLFWKDNYNAAVEYKQDDIAAALKTALDQYDAAKLIHSLSDQFAKIVASPRWNEFIRGHRERLFLSLMKENRRWIAKEIFKEKIKHLLGKVP